MRKRKQVGRSIIIYGCGGEARENETFENKFRGFFFLFYFLRYHMILVYRPIDWNTCVYNIFYPEVDIITLEKIMWYAIVYCVPILFLWVFRFDKYTCANVFSYLVTYSFRSKKFFSLLRFLLSLFLLCSFVVRVWIRGEPSSLSFPAAFHLFFPPEKCGFR